ncbi:MAG: hypothetical protein K6F88_00870 [Ruminococcus sp.]|nr:hypothetical protein [Ruminococcus sp.]
MLKKHIKAVSLLLAVCLIAVMFMIVVLLGNPVEGAGTVSEIMLLIFVAIACVPVFLVHEKHN